MITKGHERRSTYNCLAPNGKGFNSRFKTLFLEKNPDMFELGCPSCGKMFKPDVSFDAFGDKKVINCPHCKINLEVLHTMSVGKM